MKTVLATTVGVFSALSVMAGPALAAGENEAETVNCVDLMRIDNTHVVDNQNILFYLRGGGIYLNRLSHPVPNLEESNAFAYRTTIGQLCNLDSVTVLERWGFGLTEGASGTLGKFMPVDKERADELRNRD
jgi:hypothetical protein